MVENGENIWSEGNFQNNLACLIAFCEKSSISSKLLVENRENKWSEGKLKNTPRIAFTNTI